MLKKVSILTVLLLVSFCFLLSPQNVLAIESNSGYLNYQEPQAPAINVFSSVSYVISLIVTFSVVIGLAYFSSRFLGARFGHLRQPGATKIVATIPLGTNKAVYIVEIANKILVLGVTDNSINMLQEITTAEEIENIKNQYKVVAIPSDNQFERQLASLQQMSKKFPAVFSAIKAKDSRKEKHEKR